MPVFYCFKKYLKLEKSGVYVKLTQEVGLWEREGAARREEGGSGREWGCGGKQEGDQQNEAESAIGVHHSLCSLETSI